ncbi:MAG: hypothetical protein JNM69_04950 [Archangium sp.]|nr:hypothetical protein [Archangium sp.]
MRPAWFAFALVACGQWPGGGSGVVLGPTDEARREACETRRLARAAAFTPQFSGVDAVTEPVSSRALDGALVTEVGFRLRAGRERTPAGGEYPPQSFLGRSATLRIVDAVPAGRSEITVTVTTNLDLSPNGPRVQFRAFRQAMQGGVTTSNVTMAARSARVVERVVTDHSALARPLLTGDVLDFELELFFAGFDPRDPLPIAGATQAYSDTFRYRVGVGGLVPEPFDDDAPPASGAAGWSGGGLSVPFFASRDGTPIGGATAWQQLGLMVSPTAVREALDGRRLFFTDVETGLHAEPGNAPLSAVQFTRLDHFNARRCSGCHAQVGRGQLPAAGSPLESVALFSSGPLGPVVQKQEAAVTLTGFRDVRTETLANGRTVVLRAPVFDAPAEAFARVAPPLSGLGLLEAVDDATIVAAADEEDCDGDGIAGRPSSTSAGLGRFGWKGEFATLFDAIDREGREQVGVTLEAAPLRVLTSFVRVIGVPVQRGGATAQVQRGAQVFAMAGCPACHRERLETGQRHPFSELRGQVIHPYTDLLLHDLGDALADTAGSENARRWRTAPLWGLGVGRVVHGASHLLHDGRASSPLEAILWHGGEAAGAVATVKALPTDDLDALLAFLESL